MLVRCAIVGDKRIVTVSMEDKGANTGVTSLRYEFNRQAGLQYFGGGFMDVYQARQFGIPGGPFLTTTHPDFEELSRGNEDVKAMHLMEEMWMSPFSKVQDYIDVRSAPDAIHVLMKLPTPAEIEARYTPWRTRVTAFSDSDSIWTSLSRALTSYSTTATHEKKTE